MSEPYITLEELEERGTAQAMMQAAEATMGQVLTYEGGLIHAPFHAVSSGTTRSGRRRSEKGSMSGFPPLPATRMLRQSAIWTYNSCALRR